MLQYAKSKMGSTTVAITLMIFLSPFTAKPLWHAEYCRAAHDGERHFDDYCKVLSSLFGTPSLKIIFAYSITLIRRCLPRHAAAFSAIYYYLNTPESRRQKWWYKISFAAVSARKTCLKTIPGITPRIRPGWLHIPTYAMTIMREDSFISAWRWHNYAASQRSDANTMMQKQYQFAKTRIWYFLRRYFRPIWFLADMQHIFLAISSIAAAILFYYPS